MRNLKTANPTPTAKWLAKPEQDVEIRDIEKVCHFDINAVDRTAIGFMDVAAENGIWDWKTGRIRDDTAHEEKVQGSVYMAAYYDEYGHPPERVRFIYIKEGKVRSFEPSDEHWNYMIKRAKALLQAKEENEFPGNPGDHCYFCGHEFFCPEAPTGMGNVPWEEY